MWGYAMAHGDRSVDVFVRKLRQKLRTASPAWNYIHTHFGVGYRFAPEVDGGEQQHEAPGASEGRRESRPHAGTRRLTADGRAADGELTADG